MKATEAITKIGWIGTGAMGKWMCQHCMDKGFAATVFNRSLDKCQPLVEKGAKLANTPQEVAKNSDIVFTIVGHPKDVKEVIMGENGVLSGLKPGGIIVDMTTSEPNLAQYMSQEAQKMNIDVLDAPVSGGDVGAKEARLSIMCGGKKETFDYVNPLFECMGKTIKYMGPSGMGQHTKAMNQILVASGLIGITESLIYAKKAGLDLESALNCVSGGAAGSWGLNYYGPKTINRDFKPGFMVDHFVKDMGIALTEAKNMNIALPGLALIHQLYVATQTHGYGKDCVNALTVAIEAMNNMKKE